MKLALYRALAAAELKAPPSVQGTFIPVGNSFDAFAALTKVLQTASSDVLIIDPYMDETALTEFAGTVADGISLRLLADEADHKQTLATAANRWVAQHKSNRPLAVRLAPPKSLHDSATSYILKNSSARYESLSYFAKRSPAEIVAAGLYCRPEK